MHCGNKPHSSGLQQWQVSNRVSDLSKWLDSQTIIGNGFSTPVPRIVSVHTIRMARVERIDFLPIQVVVRKLCNDQQFCRRTRLLAIFWFEEWEERMDRSNSFVAYLHSIANRHHRSSGFFQKHRSLYSNELMSVLSPLCIVLMKGSGRAMQGTCWCPMLQSQATLKSS